MDTKPLTAVSLQEVKQKDYRCGVHCQEDRYRGAEVEAKTGKEADEDQCGPASVIGLGGEWACRRSLEPPC